ncbi:MAG: SGNH/GDSL hydrolase family protein [Sulfurimonas sp.]|uniref:SGNH/GDSL hydrolase family protein n=1 Tax=Sulfurimonas sp. TaxID=2022749 RepID=UPI0025EE29EC|nr:SGNH/GDSL hydrolase family protein [Sulfurimonas sp.]MCK9491393.1 SGNH/GDSL hydrolase family protein [Sulfurimonas sp.]
MANKIFTLIGDSLSMTRIDDGITLENTYIYKIFDILLKKPFICNGSIRGNSTLISSSTSYYKEYLESNKNNNYIIIHLGIVDCSPRIFNKIEKKIIDCTLGISVVNKFTKLFLNYRTKNRFYYTKKNSYVEVNIDEFDKNIRKIIKQLLELNYNLKKIFLINIASSNDYIKSKSYNIESNIIQYNKIYDDVAQSFQKIVDIIDVYSFTKNNLDGLLNDGQHISSKTHDFIANEIIKRVE